MLPPNMPQMALQHGGHPSMNLPQQVNMPPMSIHSQVPSSMPSQGHPSNMSYYPPSSYPQPTHPQRPCTIYSNMQIVLPHNNFKKKDIGLYFPLLEKVI
ncbi:unnamed protein product [Rotaria magnacalcarata]|uniref:Uncharacterized protein n=1 Tax=Rotaria magnacalcarata TaxID=392030 RepID=A0A819QI42_9BILA|nr:unnamed protein product [Rotaria magnacalcarata]CAF4029795.1 unnamed protein product [Rotaria magnacalcarata]